jgi:uncharacterized membrane protein
MVQASPLPDGELSAAGSDPLAGIPLFATLDVEERAAIRARMREERLEANEAVFWLGDRGDDFYVVTKGRVAITVPTPNGQHIVLKSLEEGGVFGEISLLDGGPRTATVRTLEPSSFLVLSRAAFHAFLHERPDLATEMLTVMGQRQRVSTEALRSMQNPNVAFDELPMTRWQRISDTIASVAAGQWFTIIHLLWFGLWIGLNGMGLLFQHPPAIFSWDPFPFGLLTMVVSLEAIFLSIFVLVSQNRQAEKDRIRTDLDYQVNVKAQTEIMKMARRIERLEVELCGPEESARGGDAKPENLLERT